jgi:type II secretory pathway component PulF
MALFHYRAADAAGNVVQGVLEAREERQVAAFIIVSLLLPILNLYEIQF